MKRPLPNLAIVCCLTAGTVTAAPAQTAAFRVSAIDMCGGAVFPSQAEPGVAFGARVGLLDLVAGSLRAGLELDWWTAERQDVELEVSDIVAGIAIWKELGTAVLRPYFGLGFALHSVDATLPGGDMPPDGEPPESDRISGYKGGASGFAGLTLRLSRTGAFWLILEYRYSAVSEVSHHEARAGARLRTSRR